MDLKKRPIGVELLSKGIITENDIDTVISYQKNHQELQFGEILYVLGIVPAKTILDALAEKFDCKPILLSKSIVKISPTKYLSMDYIKKNKVLPFAADKEKVKVAFSDMDNKEVLREVEKNIKKLGLKLEKYLTLGILIDEALDLNVIDRALIIPITGDVTKTVDKIIKDAMEKRASDLHFEPLSDSLRVRIRVDGELLVYGVIEEKYKAQVIGRLKAISNMFQEKQESQDGRITDYPDYNIRVSSQRNIYGDKIVLRLLKKNSTISELGQLGFPDDEEFMKKYFGRVNGITILTAPTGEGKTTTLYSIINKLNDPSINITTIEDPVEIRIPGLNQIEINDNVNFIDSLRTVLRQDPEIILVGEIRDMETAEMAISSAHTGHYVLTTLHAMSAIDSITRLRKLGLSNYDISGTINTIVSQRLIRRFCDCAKPREFTAEEKKIIKKVSDKYDIKFNTENVKTYDPVGCEKCNNTGFYERIAVYEIIEFSDLVRDMINNDASILQIKNQLLKEGFEPIYIDAVRKVLNGITSFTEVAKKISFNNL